MARAVMLYLHEISGSDYLTLNQEKHPWEKSFNFFKTDCNGMRADLKSTDWNFLTNLGAKEMWCHIKVPYMPYMWRHIRDVIESNIASPVPRTEKV